MDDSLGAFNSLSTSLLHPDLISAVTVISLFVVLISPFKKAFEQKVKVLKMSDFQSSMLKFMCMNVFTNKEKWF